MTSFSFHNVRLQYKVHSCVVAYESPATIGRRAEPMLMVGASGSARVRGPYLSRTLEKAAIVLLLTILSCRVIARRAWCYSLATGSIYAAVA
jgi:hypothetical protein